VIVAGFGRIGEMVADMLEEHGIDYVAVEGDPDLVAKGRKKGHKVWFGDAASVEALERFGLAGAKVLVTTMDSRKGVETNAAAARARRPDIAIIARARDPGHVAKLYEMGVSEAVPEALEASLHISEATLIGAGVPLGLAIAAVHDRRDRYRDAFLNIDRGHRLAPAARVRARREARRPPSGPAGGGAEAS
jgi:CPA2 family monovalent cation:H+ antiporter-2